MPVQLNHTIVWCHDNRASAAFLADMLGLPEPVPFAHFMVVHLDNGVSMDFMAKEGPVAAQHYAFLVDDAGFDHGMARIAAQGIDYWADPARSMAGQINRHWGGRGVYFLDPDGHVLELITKPYGAEKDA
jgi:catechol 2,3-dioxygenase-like lactoylglutathione lyase family enzyme